MKSITPARGHQSLRAHAIRNLFYFLYECSCTHFIFFNLGLNLGAVPRMGRQSRCTYPFWVFASFFFFLCVCVCVLHYKFILYITKGAPNKAVKKKKKEITIIRQFFIFIESFLCCCKLFIRFSQVSKQFLASILWSLAMALISMDHCLYYFYH